MNGPDFLRNRKKRKPPIRQLPHVCPYGPRHPYVGIIQIRFSVEGHTFLSACVTSSRLFICRSYYTTFFPGLQGGTRSFSFLSRQTAFHALRRRTKTGPGGTYPPGPVCHAAIFTGIPSMGTDLSLHSPSSSLPTRRRRPGRPATGNRCSTHTGVPDALSSQPVRAEARP